jgi:hypothetical protein
MLGRTGASPSTSMRLVSVERFHVGGEDIHTIQPLTVSHHSPTQYFVTCGIKRQLMNLVPYIFKQTLINTPRFESLVARHSISEGAELPNYTNSRCMQIHRPSPKTLGQPEHTSASEHARCCCRKADNQSPTGLIPCKGDTRQRFFHVSAVEISNGLCDAKHYFVNLFSRSNIVQF